MTRLVHTAFRRMFLPALLLLLPAAAFSFATSQAPGPTTFPTTAPVRTSDPQRILPDDNPASYGNARTTSPSAASGPVKITAVPAPFMSIATGDQIVREFIVQNDSAKPIDVKIVMNYRIGWRGDRVDRSVTTSRKIPAKSIQTVSVYVPSCLDDDDQNMEVFDPRIYVDDRSFKPLPPGIFDIGSQECSYYSASSSFDAEESVLTPLVNGIITKTYHSYGWRNMESAFSNSDTIQWPAIPQFYQAKDLIIRKTTDKFTPDAERAIRDAVMLGATEMLFVAEGTRAPAWAPAPPVPGVPVIVPRGFGRTIVIDERAFASIPGLPQQIAAMSENMPDSHFENGKGLGPRNNGNGNEEKAISGMIQPFVDYLKTSDLFIVIPAAVCQMLPCVDIPNMSFAIVILALLAYIVIVGPVNYFYLIRHKKSILLLLLTVPVISFVFVGIVIVFVTLFEGWYSRASAVGMTFLDQQESMAYTRAAVSLYAPLPVRRLTFDPSDTVSFARAKNADVSLGRDQVVTGANKARVPLVYGVSRAEKHLEQLKVSRNAAGTLTVMNGLGAPVRLLAMRTPDGEYWLPPDDMIQPGASAELKPFTGMAAGAFDLALPDKFGSQGGDIFTVERDRMFHALFAWLYEKSPEDSPDGNTARRGTQYTFGGKRADLIRNALASAPAGNDGLSPLAGCLSPGMYIAETDRPMFYAPGCSPVSFRARHIVAGTFTLQESAHEN